MTLDPNFERSISIEGDANSYHCKRYIVRNLKTGIVGTYGVHHDGDGKPCGASRDYHEPATEAAWEARAAYLAGLANDDADEPDYARPVDRNCPYLPPGPCHCDGSGLVEVVTDDEAAFKIAHMMAGE